MKRRLAILQQKEAVRTNYFGRRENIGDIEKVRDLKVKNGSETGQP